MCWRREEFIQEASLSNSKYLPTTLMYTCISDNRGPPDENNGTWEFWNRWWTLTEQTHKLKFSFALLQLQSSVEWIIHTTQLHIHTPKRGHKHKIHVCTCRRTCTTGHVLGWVVFGCSSWLDWGPVFERSKLRPVVLIWEVSLSLKRHWRHHNWFLWRALRAFSLLIVNTNGLTVVSVTCFTVALAQAL